MNNELVLNLFNRIIKYRYKYPRLRDARQELRLKDISFRQLTKQEKNMVSSIYGGKYKPNMSYLRLYNSGNDKFNPYYIPDDFYYSEVDMFFNNPERCAALDDKNLYDLYFSDVCQPRTISRIINGSFLDEKYNIVDFAYTINSCIAAEQVCIKESYCSNGGHGIRFWDVSEGKSRLEEILRSVNTDVVIQERFRQNESLSILHPNSVNTIRLLSLNYHGLIHILSGILRMGSGGSDVDNGHSGGIFVGIEPNGSLKSVAYNYMTGEIFQHSHPTTGVVFDSCSIPNYQGCCELVKRIAPRLSGFSKLTSWDFSIDEEKNPTLIEVNMAYGGLYFHQMANGPVFGDLTQEIIKEVLTNKR